MASSRDFLSMPTSAFLDHIAEATPSPSAGSALALTGASAAALVEMVAGLTCVKPKYAAFHERSREIQTRAHDLRAALENAVNEDAEAVQQMIAERRSRDAATTAEEKARHEEGAQAALVRAVTVPFRIAEVCVEVAFMGMQLVKFGMKSARGDASSAVILALAAVDGSLDAVEANLGASKQEDEWSAEIIVEITGLRVKAADLREQLASL